MFVCGCGALEAVTVPDDGFGSGQLRLRSAAASLGYSLGMSESFGQVSWAFVLVVALGGCLSCCWLGSGPSAVRQEAAGDPAKCADVPGRCAGDLARYADAVDGASYSGFAGATQRLEGARIAVAVCSAGATAGLREE